MLCPIMTIGCIETGDHVACKGEDCAMWDFERECCGLRVLSPTEARTLLRADD